MASFMLFSMIRRKELALEGNSIATNTEPYNAETHKAKFSELAKLIGKEWSYLTQE